MTDFVVVVVVKSKGLYYDEGKGRDDFCKKNKFRCKVSKSEKRLVKLRETIW